MIGWMRTDTGFVNDNVGAGGGGDEGDCIGGTGSRSIVLRFDIEVERFCSICGCAGSKKIKINRKLYPFRNYKSHSLRNILDFNFIIL